VNEPIEQVPTIRSYIITNNLSNVTNSNTASTITESESYTATLASDSGYTLDGATVAITMGGIDVTSTVYANGVIGIASVTGDIVITANAVKTSGYTNLLPLATTSPTDSTIYGGDYNGDGVNDGYMNNARYSSSASGIITASGYQITGIIPTTSIDDIIRIKGVDTIQFFMRVRDDGTMNGFTPSDYYSDGYAQPDSNGVYTFVHPTTENVPIVGVRFSGKGIDGDTIITVNEEII
jgi:hypothetical protein